MSQDLRQRIYDELTSLVLVDPHTHINALDPASHTLADILGYHYYTELAHSAGMPKEQIEEPGLDPKEKVARLIENLGPIDNTIQYSWFVEMAQAFFGFDGDMITKDNWEPLYDRAAREMAADDWPETVLSLSKLEAVFLTNDFDDPLQGFDTKKYIPCLRTDDLVFHLSKREVQERLAQAAGAAVRDATTLKHAIGKLFEHFAKNNARACAISLPPDFAPIQIPDGRANTAISSIYAQGPDASDVDKKAAANFVFWTLTEYCADFCLPFDLMIGVNRGVYEAGVHQGHDLYDSRVSLIQYRELFNAFPQVTFPISVLASVTSQELASYAWIFPNVVTNGHWWYSNTPTFIEHDAAARLEAVPRTKQIGYYSDMYKLEFALPKFNMYKRILAKILAERYVIDRGWTEERAVAFGKQILRDNVESVFRLNEEPVLRTIESPQPVAPVDETPRGFPADDFATSWPDDNPASAKQDDIFSADLNPTEEDQPIDAEEVQPASPMAHQFMPSLSPFPAPTSLEDDSLEENADDIVDLVDDSDDSSEGETDSAAQPFAFPSTTQPTAVPMAAPVDSDEIIEDIFADDDDSPSNAAQIGRGPLEATPMATSSELPMAAPLDFGSLQPAESNEAIPVQPQPIVPTLSETDDEDVAADDEISIDDILDDEFSPPGFTMPPARTTAPQKPVDTFEIESGEDDAVEDLFEDDLIDEDLSPPNFGDDDDDDVDEGFPQINPASVDDDEFPGIKI